MFVALNFNYIHNELPFSKKLAKLISKHYLSILKYNYSIKMKMESMKVRDFILEADKEK